MDVVAAKKKKKKPEETDLVSGVREKSFQEVTWDLKPEVWVGGTKSVDGTKTGRQGMWCMWRDCFFLKDVQLHFTILQKN